ncbi:MAG TPA: hypothetical protein VEI06_00920 [Gemmatimonadaceae bacterium]|nr:hypothetical protein [Gemmatimonadaceae bacterium]
MLVRYLVVSALAFAAVRAGAQSAADHITVGDTLHAQFKDEDALEQYREAVKVDSNSYEALWRISRDAVDLGEFQPDKTKQRALYDEGLAAAQHALRLKPQVADSHFWVARALGRVALSLGKKDRVRYAKDVRAHALEALAIDSLNSGALHVMGVWNAEIMRLSGISRFMARNFLGGDVFSQANWNEAVRYMEKAVAVDPHRLTHQLDLALVYRDRDKAGDKERAKQQFQAVIDGKVSEYNDPNYKNVAEKALAEMSH